VGSARGLARWAAVALLVVVLPSCQSTAPSLGSSSTPPANPDVACLGGLDQLTCNQALDAILGAIAQSGWTPTHVWINSGSFAPVPNLLFDPRANFPAPKPPAGGTTIGNAEVAFAETEKHAGLNLARVGTNIVAGLIGYVVPHPGWCSGTCSG
jgi:hypothetical protein